MNGKNRYPQRIVCLTEETVETLYRIGAGDLVVGVSGFVVRPQAARSKPKVSTFTDANYDKIAALKPDLVLAFSDLQADIAAELARRGIAVHLFNQRSIEEILTAMRVTGALVGRAAAAGRLADRLARGLDRLSTRAAKFGRVPRLFFEEWHEPLISGIAWCSELMERVGGVDVCRESRNHRDARGRIFTSDEILRRDPEAIVASWCGKMARKERIVGRDGWSGMTAVRDDQLYEIPSPLILQPGPAALSDGAAQLFDIVQAVAHGKKLAGRTRGGLRKSTRKITYM